jgi:hypothetical protein
MRTRNVPHPGVLRIGKASFFTTPALGVCIALEYTVTFCRLHVAPKPLVLLSLLTFTGSIYLGNANIFLAIVHSQLSDLSSIPTTMHCLWCFRSRRTRHRRHEQTHVPQTRANLGSEMVPLQRTEPTQPQPQSQSQSQSLPRTPPPRPLLDDSSSSLSSMSSGSIVRAAPLEDPFVTRQTSTTTTHQSAHTTGFQRRTQVSARLPDTQSSFNPSTLRHRRTNDTSGPINSLRSHNGRMVRSQTRQTGPRSREDSPTPPPPRTPNLSFSARLAQVAGTILPQPTFLDDDSSASSDDGGSHRHDDSGYISALTTPAKPNMPEASSAAAPTIQIALIPAPPFFYKPPMTLSALLDISESPQSRTAKPLCNQRHCLRHKQTCLEHAPTPSPPLNPSRIPQLKTQDRRLRRRPRVRESQSLKDDVWVQVATEYPPGA